MKDQPKFAQTKSGKDIRIRGYVAISTVLIIGALVLVVGISLTITAINDSQSSFAAKKSSETLDFVEGCVEDALIKLSKTGSIPVSISLPEGNCSVTINSNVGTTWNFSVNANRNGFTKKITVTASRGNAVGITSWTETN